MGSVISHWSKPLKESFRSCMSIFLPRPRPLSGHGTHSAEKFLQEPKNHPAKASQKVVSVQDGEEKHVSSRREVEL
ncbi:Udp-Glucuronosyltransferase 1A1 [Manis pentadactyla]|nr:Udp-Glucuronosyltransferase 1A1 [Manis pentadactyla]